MKIEFGCGENPSKQDFMTCDIRNLPGINYVCNAWDVDKLIEPKEVKFIFSRHFFEHLTLSQAARTLKAWHEVLDDGGKVEMVVPNMDYHVAQYLLTRLFPFQFFDSIRKHSEAGFWGWQRESEIDESWDVHKFGYNFSSLKDLVKSCGYKNIKKINSRFRHLHIIFEK